MTLEDIRREIDEIDREMKELFLRRMRMSEQVAKAKSVTGGDVYVAEREQEIIKKRTEEMPEEWGEPYIAFLRHMMNLSRTYQYSLLEGMQRKYLKELPQGQGEVSLTFAGTPEGFYACVDGLQISGLTVEVMKREDSNGGCNLKLSGDFTDPLAKAAVLQILKETESAQLVVTRE